MEQNKEKYTSCQDFPITEGSTSILRTTVINSAPKKVEGAPEKVENNQHIGNSENGENIPKINMGFDGSSLHTSQSGSKAQTIFPTFPIVEECFNQQQQSLEEEIQEYDDEQYDYEFEELLIDEPIVQNLQGISNTLSRENNPIMISEDPPFSEKDLEEFINNDDTEGVMDQATFEGTFHSLHNSINSSSSFINGMERLIVQQIDHSKSTSSKRKVMEGTEDTATSGNREGEKIKI